MSDASAAAAALFGVIAIIFVLVPGVNYYASMLGPRERRLPEWWGRLWFLGFAAIMFYLACHHFLTKR